MVSNSAANSASFAADTRSSLVIRAMVDSFSSVTRTTSYSFSCLTRAISNSLSRIRCATSASFSRVIRAISDCFSFTRRSRVLPFGAADHSPSCSDFISIFCLLATYGANSPVSSASGYHTPCATVMLYLTHWEPRNPRPCYPSSSIAPWTSART
jgi:hypothetical protein